MNAIILKIMTVRYQTLSFLMLMLCGAIMLGAAAPVIAQPDTLSWQYVIDQEWERPARFDSLAGVHPRLLINAARISELKSRIHGTHEFLWDVVKAKADNYLYDNPNNSPGSEDDTRKDGDAVPWLAMAFLLTDDAKYANKAIDWMTAVCNYSTWDGNRSLAAGHCLMGMSLGYDWLYNNMTSNQRQSIRVRLSHFAAAMSVSPQHKERYLSNHCQVEYAGLAAAGLALYDEVAEAEIWIRQALNIFNEAYQVGGADGSSTEGHQYYGLMTEFQMHFNKMARELLGRDFYRESEWLQNVGNFILYSTLPNFTSDNCVMRYGDTRLYDYRTHGPTYQLFNVASEYSDPYLQWLALEMFGRDIGATDRMGWANLLWYDETIAPLAPDSLPTFRHFDDTGWITSRSDWTDNAVMIGFKCGPFHGHAVQELYDTMTDFHQIVNGHGHPDVNHFNIYAYGKWLAVDDGYLSIKWTNYHNTIIVDGYGQLGEGTKYFDRNTVFKAKATSRIIKAESNSSFDYIVGDAENIYRPEAGLQKFLRHFVFIKPDVILILDELEAEKTSKFEWLMHTEGDITGLGDQIYQIVNGDVKMDIDFLLPDAVLDAKTLNLLKVFPARNVSKTLMLAAMHPRRSTDPQMSARIISAQDSILTLEIEIGEEIKTVTLDVASRELNITSSGALVESIIGSNSPGNYRLSNYPNPFNPSTTILYYMPKTGDVKLTIYNILGHKIITLVSAKKQDGNHTVDWCGRDERGRLVSQGLYVIELVTDDFVQIRKILYLK